MSTQTRFRDFASFYPYYLSEHEDRRCRLMHFIGTALVIGTTIVALTSLKWRLLLLLPLFGYGFAWAGHFLFEKNRPATFRYPLYSLMGDFAMFRDMLGGRIRF